MWEDTFDKMQAVGQSITLEQRSPYLREAKLDQTIWQIIQLFLRGVRLWSGFERSREQSHKWGQTELVHVVDLDEVTKHHE